MKTLSLTIALALFGVISCTKEKDKIQSGSVEVQNEEAYGTTVDGRKVHLKEDKDYKTNDGQEVEYDKDPIGDDQVEYDD